MNKEQIQKELDSIDRQTKIIKLQCKLYCAYQSFMFRFMNKDDFKVYTFRNHYGSYMAFGMAIHNTDKIYQPIILITQDNPFLSNVFIQQNPKIPQSSNILLFLQPQFILEYYLDYGIFPHLLENQLQDYTLECNLLFLISQQIKNKHFKISHCDQQQNEFQYFLNQQ